MNWFLFTLRNAFNFTGRSRRKEFGWFLLITSVIAFSLTFIKEMALLLSFVQFAQLFDFMSILISFAALVIGLSLTTRRLHDMGHSGWWQMILVPRFITDLYFLLEAPSDEALLNLMTSGTLTGTIMLLSSLVSLILTLFCLFKDGQKHPNKYGESPKYQTEEKPSTI